MKRTFHNGSIRYFYTLYKAIENKIGGSFIFITSADYFYLGAFRYK